MQSHVRLGFSTSLCSLTPPCFTLLSETIENELSSSLDTFFPPSPHPNSMLTAPMASHLRSERDFERQLGFLEQAKKEGKLVYEGERDIGTKRMGFSIVKLELDGVGEKGALVEEEIFGPVLPIIPISVSDDSPSQALSTYDFALSLWPKDRT